MAEAGYSTVLQTWDFAAGGNFVLEMDRAAREARRTVAVLSDNTFSARYTQPEWAAACVQDPTGAQRRLIPVRVRECTPACLLAAIADIDRVGLEPAAARTQLLARSLIEECGYGRRRPELADAEASTANGCSVRQRRTCAPAGSEPGSRAT